MYFLLDSMQTGSNTPDGNIGNGNYLVLLIVFVLGVIAGYGIRCIVQAIKNAPSGKTETKDSKEGE